MRVISYVYDSSDAAPHVDAVLDLLESRRDAADRLDVASFDDRDEAYRVAMLTVKQAVRIGSPPDALFDETGRPDFSAGALVTEEPTGRRSLHVGPDAAAALRESD